MAQEADFEERVEAYLRGGWGRPQRTEDRSDCAWYAIRAVALQERTVAAYLSERGLPVFVPMATDWRGGARHMEPLMPGYVFTLCAPEDFADIHGVEGVAGFVRYVREDGAAWPAAFPSRVILGLQIEERQGAYDATRRVKPPTYRPRKGEVVTITAGTYYGYIAKVLEAPKGERCKLLIEAPEFDAPRKRTEDVAHLTAA